MGLGGSPTYGGTLQTRTFAYDSLKRLTQAINPESGTINYTYDANSNLLSKQDARLITTTYTYDALNRMKSRTYAADPQSTPAVAYRYDNQSLPTGAPSFTPGSSIGRLVAVTYGTASAGSYQGYDNLGRVNVSYQQTDSQNYGFGYGYNLASEMTAETYPSGRQVITEYDTAGRAAGISARGYYYAGSSPSDATNRIQYASHGAVSVMALGNGKWEHTTYEPKRLQPTQIGLGTSGTDSSILKLDYGYGTTTNNGNVMSQTITAPKAGGGNLVLTQTYTYDSLNRLLSASENGSPSWAQNYDYDRYGNRAVNPSSTLLPNPTLTPQSLNNFSTATNRITLTGFAYDAAGNMKNDPTTTPNPPNGMTYDGENRQVSYTKAGGATSYFYDGDGHRVKKIAGSVTTLFVYNAIGQLTAEYTNDTAPPVGGGGTSYLASDHLGSTRLVMKSDGTTVKARYDYLPFGEEIPSTIGGRGSVTGYGGADSTKQKFTQKERDNESGLDYFLARYYSSSQGRFTGVDPTQKSAKPIDPRSWNRYVYTLNNPLALVDNNGKWPTPTHDRIITRALPGLQGTNALRNIQHGSNSVDWGDSGFLPHTIIPGEAYKHAMVPAGKIKELGSYSAAREWAQGEMNKFIQTKLNEAKENVRKFEVSVAVNGVGDQNYMASAQQAFGEAIHPIMDNVSPAHRDFQVYDTSGWNLSLNGLINAGADLYAHGKAEERDPTGEEMERMTTEIRKLYVEVFGAKRLKDVETDPKNRQ